MRSVYVKHMSKIKKLNQSAKEISKRINKVNNEYRKHCKKLCSNIFKKNKYYFMIMERRHIWYSVRVTDDSSTIKHYQMNTPDIVFCKFKKLEHGSLWFTDETNSKEHTIQIFIGDIITEGIKFLEVEV